MKLLLHQCCAPCSVAVVDALRADGIDVTGYFFNPNIHPFTEYRARRDALIDYAKKIDLPLTVRDEYGLRSFCAEVVKDLNDRCGTCYEMRLFPAAEYAASHGFDAFSTTLLVSPFQRHDELRDCAQRAEEKYGVKFLYRDFRPLFRDGQARARELGLYMQKYCGCIFSEEERYSKKK